MPHKYFCIDGVATYVHHTGATTLPEELEEGPRLLSNVVGCEPSAVEIGTPVRVEFAPPEQDGEGFAVPRFRPT